MLRHIAAAARAFRDRFARTHRHHRNNRRRRAVALRDATSAFCDPLEKRLHLTVALASIDTQNTTEGADFTLNVAVYVDYFDNNDPDDYANVLVDFGDGGTASTTVGSGASFLPFHHTYADDGAYA